jgi:hypothetical protein
VQLVRERQTRYHQAISVTVLDSTGRLLMEPILETKAETILQFYPQQLACDLQEGACTYRTLTHYSSFFSLD